jgi:hypothetical protein
MTANWSSSFFKLALMALVGILLVSGVSLVTGDTPAAQAATPMALINGDTVSGSPSQEEQIATAQGLLVTVVPDSVWATYTASDFGQYDLLIAGDPTCGVLPPGLIATAPTYGSVVLGTAGGRTLAGNRIVVGTDPVFHDGGDYSSVGARGTIIRDGIAFAGKQPGRTGMYFDATCGANTGDPGQVAGTLAILASLSAGAGPWTIDAVPPCGGSVSLIASEPSFSDLTTASLQGWGCSVHESFPTFPTDWSALAVATDTVTQPTCGVDPNTALPACGEAYILLAGSSIVVVSGSISLTPTDATNPAGTSHTVTAHVTSGGSPLAGQVVTFTVTGQNAGAVGTCVPVGCVTDGNGEVTFTYLDANGAGDDTIKASFTDAAGSLQSATVQKHWVAPAGADISVTKVCDTQAVPGDQFQCTVTVKNLGPSPATGVTVNITETGAVIAFATPSQGSCGATPTVSLNCALGNLAVNASATVTIMVQTGVAPGPVSDTASGSATETDPNGANNAATATTAVVVPASTLGCKITDGGRITATNGDKATFGANAQAPDKGEQEYQDHGLATDINVHSISITAVVCSTDGNSGSIFGTATINGVGSFAFRIDVKDLGEPGTNDTYRIRLSNGYDSGAKVLTGGNIQIHK